MGAWPLLAVLALSACDEGGSTSTLCDDLCRELVQGCDYRAFPSLDSCRQGCDYEKSQGADIEAHHDCVMGAECNTFEIVECEHAYGIAD